MVNLTIDGRTLSVPAGTTILKASYEAGINIPHLCFEEGINDIGACRVCVVEIDGIEKLATACNNVVWEGMKIYTNSPRVRSARKVNVELILSDHDCMCATCVRSGNCGLQKVSNDLGIDKVEYPNIHEMNRWDKRAVIIRDASKCIKCMRCIQTCDKIQGLNVWDLLGSGYRTTVGVSENKRLNEVECALCGQCITHCPVGALRVRADIERLFEAIADPDKITVVQIAPAIRTAWFESLGLTEETASLEMLVGALKRMGIDYVFDTTFTADLTIMEEGTEFLERYINPEKHKWPMFTSCCPGWLRFVKTQYPDMVENLSTCKSPQQMFGALFKTYVAEKLGIEGSKVFSVSIMPCTAKKWEADVPEVNDAGHGQDVDLVLTTREIAAMIRAERMEPKDIISVPFDDFFGEGSGAGVIFGATSGVMEAALRSAYYLVTGENPAPNAFENIRGLDGWKEGTFNIAGNVINVAIASGLSNVRNLIEAIRNNQVSYDFVEIMACPGGCAGGGGQPIHEGINLVQERENILYGLDDEAELRFSHENKQVAITYEEFLEKPLGHKSHCLLHTDVSKWTL